MKRVVSLLPSATEILCQIGGIDLLVGRSHECDFPGSIADLPVLTGQKTAYDPNAGIGSAQIDAQVRAAMESSEALYTIDADRLVDLAPDVILTQAVCDVCSIDLDSVRACARRVGEATGHEPEVIALDSETIEGVWDDHLLVGKAVGLGDEAARAVFELRSRWIRAESFVNPYTEGPVVGFLEWTDPLFVAGHWTVQMIERAGGRHPLNECVPRENMGAAAGMQAGQRVAGKSIRVPAEAFAATRPEYLIVCPCGLTLEQAEAETRKLAETTEWWGDLPAVRAGRVAVVDGNQMFNRPGPRLVDAFEWLVGWLNGRGELEPEGFPWRLLSIRG
jgi:iron complex transport system substrate-binding protein